MAKIPRADQELELRRESSVAELGKRGHQRSESFTAGWMELQTDLVTSSQILHAGACRECGSCVAKSPGCFLLLLCQQPQILLFLEPASSFPLAFKHNLFTLNKHTLDLLCLSRHCHSLNGGEKQEGMGKRSWCPDMVASFKAAQ